MRSPAAHIPTHNKNSPLHMVCIMMSSPETSHDFIASKLNITIHHRCTLFQTAHIEQQHVHLDRAQKSGLHGSQETFIGHYEHTHVMHIYNTKNIS